MSQSYYIHRGFSTRPCHHLQAWWEITDLAVHQGFTQSWFSDESN